MRIRPENPADQGAIHALNCLCFPSDAEAKLVDQLRRDGAVGLSLVAERDGNIIGHALFSRMIAPDNTLALAPVATHPEHQRQGIAASLIRRGLQDCAADAVFVLGEPGYYTRFGFSLNAAKVFQSPYAGDYFMALVNDPPVTTTLTYPKAFTDLD